MTEAARHSPRKDLPNILLLCLDCVRADYLLGSGVPFQVAPRLNALASAGVVFTNCYTSAPWTLASFATLFTGSYPSEHGADSYQAYFSTSAPTLAEELSAAYQTACVSYNPYLSHRFNLTQGFERTYVFGRYIPAFYSDRSRHHGWRKFPELLRLMLTRRGRIENLTGMIRHLASTWASRNQLDGGAARNNQIIRSFFAGKRDRPLFLVANYMEAHWPYFFDPTAGFLSAQEAESIHAKLQFSFPFGPITGRVQVSPAERRLLGALYASAIHSLDRKIDELYEILRKDGVLENTYLIVFADHGEMLGEQGLYAHALTLHNRVLHVPLLIVPPAGQSWRRVVSKRFRLHDLRRLILLLAGGRAADARAYLDGYPVAQPIYAEYFGNQDRLTFEVKQFLDDSPHLRWPLAALIDGQYKFVRSGGGMERLYDLATDPAEEVDIAASKPAVAGEMRRALQDFQARLQKAANQDRIDSGKGMEERLRALGYL